MNTGFKIIDNVLLEYEGSDSIVTIPEGVTTIGKNAFKDNKILTELIMSDSVTLIEEHAFGKCIKLKSVVCSKNLETLKYGAFSGCKVLKEMKLPSTFKKIEGAVFAGCVKLAKITCNAQLLETSCNPFHAYDESECKLLFDKDGFLIFSNVLYQYNKNEEVIRVPEGVTHIANLAFKSESYSWANKRVVKKVILPDSLQYIGKLAFLDCEKLSEINIHDSVQVDDCAFKGCCKLADDKGFVIAGKQLHSYYGNDTVVEIPSGVEILTDRLFCVEYGANPINKNITKVILPEGLKCIGDSVFKGCAALEEIHIPESVTSIGVSAFCNCTNLKTISISSHTTIGNDAFYNCMSLMDENQCIVINDILFQCMNKQTEFTVNDHIKIISNNAFNNLRFEKITLPKNLKELGAAFDGCEWLQEIEIPENVQAIQPYTFSKCTSLKKVVLPNDLLTIGKMAFSNCASLEIIQIPSSVHTIGYGAFENCRLIKSLELPNSIKELSHVCFNCVSLENVVIANGIESIVDSAFQGCISLKQIVLPNSIKKIGRHVFCECENLESVVMDNDDCDIDLSAFNSCPKLVNNQGMKIVNGTLIEYLGKDGVVTIPSTVKTIATNAFREGYYDRMNRYASYRSEGTLHELVIPSSVKVIGDSAFKNCNKLSKVVIEEGVECIEDYAFMSCESLKEVILPKSLVSLGKSVFERCKQLVRIDVEEGNITYSSIDGILYNVEQTAIVYCPAGKKLRECVVSDTVSKICDHAFIDCIDLTKIVIPASVKEIGNEVFVRSLYSRNEKIKEICVANGAGATYVGDSVFGFNETDSPLVYPMLPVLFPKEQTTQVRLTLGFCLHPEKYTEEYAQDYRKYAQSHQKTLLKKAAQLNLKAVEEYFNTSDSTVYKPNLTLKKPSELNKVEVLEEAVLKGTVEDVKAVLETYKTFEITARALGLAARYRGLNFVKVLGDYGATFKYSKDTTIQRKYTVAHKTAAGSYSTEYCLMLVPEKLNLKYSATFGSYAYDYTPMCGVSHMNIDNELETKVLPLKDRIEVAKYLFENKQLLASMDEMLFWAITHHELSFADALIEMGATLSDSAPTYYPTWSNSQTYVDIITTGTQSVYWSSYISQISKLKDNEVLPVFERLHKLVQKENKKLILTQKLFDEIKWNDASLAFAIENIDLSKVNQKKALEFAVSNNNISTLSKMAEAGWISQSTKRENLITYAQNNQKHEALAWLLDFKNRTVDIVKEEAKAEAKAMRELMEDPNSVSAMKKIWGYKKLEDGTLIITSYKGHDTEVVVPSMIGKNKVTKIGEYAFSASEWNSRSKNLEDRKKIVSIVIPEGVIALEKLVFDNCSSLEKVVLPSTVKTMASPIACDCRNLKDINIENIEITDDKIMFIRCDALYDSSGCIIQSGRLLGHIERNGWSKNFGAKKSIDNITIPEGVTEIMDRVLHEARMVSLTLPNTLTTIGNYSFSKCFYLRELVIPKSVKIIKTGAFENCISLQTIKLYEGITELGDKVFYDCKNLNDVYIPKSVTKIGKHMFGQYDKDILYNKVTGIIVHTQEGAPIVEYLKNYSFVYIEYDYDEKMGK